MMSASEYVGTTREPDIAAVRAARSTSVAKRSIVRRHGGGLQVEPARKVAGTGPGPPERQQLVDALLREVLGTSTPGSDDVVRAGSSVRAQDLAHALPRDSEAHRDLVEAEALPAQRRHLTSAWPRPVDGHVIVGRGKGGERRRWHRAHVT